VARLNCGERRKGNGEKGEEGGIEIT